MENVQENRAKNKKLKHVLCYFSLVILIILLVLPPVFRLVYKKEEEPEKPKDVVTILKCTKEEESISSTFLNDAPKNLTYKTSISFISDKLKTEELGTNENRNDPSYQMIKKFSGYSNIEYDEENQTASISIEINNLKGSADFDAIFGTYALQETYFSTNGFSCTQEKL